MEARAIIGWNLRRLRVAQGVSQERLALTAGVGRAYVGRVERGSENVTIATLEAMARALKVPVAQLLVEPDGEAERPTPLTAGRKPARYPRAHRTALSEAVRRPSSARISRSSRKGLVSSNAGIGSPTSGNGQPGLLTGQRGQPSVKGTLGEGHEGATTWKHPSAGELPCIVAPGVVGERQGPQSHRRGSAAGRLSLGGVEPSRTGATAVVSAEQNERRELRDKRHFGHAGRLFNVSVGVAKFTKPASAGIQPRSPRHRLSAGTAIAG
jgi:transcriptional regulator with XRE-family HTH domain